MKRKIEYCFYRAKWEIKKRLGLDFDKDYAKAAYVSFSGRHLNLRSPKRFNEKLQWIKLYYRRRIMTELADKYAVREWIKEKIGEEYLIPLLGVYNSFDEIDFDKLPNEFVIKCNHDCDSVVICNNKATFDIQKAKEKIDACMARNYYYFAREWVYKDIQPKVIIESLLKDDSKDKIYDYKFFCFNGEPKIVYVSLNDVIIDGKYAINYYDMDFNQLTIRHMKHPSSSIVVKKPFHFKKMIKLANILSKDFPFVRVDFYEVNNRIFFGEMTFYPTGGFNELCPDEWNDILGSWLKLPSDIVIE